MLAKDEPLTPILVREDHLEMKAILEVMFLVLSLSFHAYAQSPKPATLRSVLLEQLRTTHNEEDWFVPATSVFRRRDQQP